MVKQPMCGDCWKIGSNGISWVDEISEILFENQFPQLDLNPQLYIGAYYGTYVKSFKCKNCSNFHFPSNSSMIDNQILFEQEVWLWKVIEFHHGFDWKDELKAWRWKPVTRAQRS